MERLFSVVQSTAAEGPPDGDGLQRKQDAPLRVHVQIADRRRCQLAGKFNAGVPGPR